MDVFSFQCLLGSSHRVDVVAIDMAIDNSIKEDGESP